MREIGTRATLFASGIILSAIGSAFMIAPQTFLAMSEVFVEQDPGLMSEVTAQSGLLVISGGFLILSAIKLRFANAGLLFGAFVYGSYGCSRLVSMQLHGVPSDTLVVVAYFELCVAAVLVVIRSKRPSNASTPFAAFRSNTIQTN